MKYILLSFAIYNISNQSNMMYNIDVAHQILSMNLHDLAIHCPEKVEGSWNGDACFGTRLSFDISQVTLLRNRHDSRNVCNDTLKNEDTKIMETLMNDAKVNCLPAYWMGLQNYYPNYLRCNTATQYKRISEMTSNFTSHEYARNYFTRPCEEMIIVTNVQ